MSLMPRAGTDSVPRAAGSGPLDLEPGITLSLLLLTLSSHSKASEISGLLPTETRIAGLLPTEKRIAGLLPTEKRIAGLLPTERRIAGLLPTETKIVE
jgi:hypothetical protein